MKCCGWNLSWDTVTSLFFIDPVILIRHPQSIPGLDIVY